MKPEGLNHLTVKELKKLINEAQVHDESAVFIKIGNGNVLQAVVDVMDGEDECIPFLVIQSVGPQPINNGRRTDGLMEVGG